MESIEIKKLIELCDYYDATQGQWPEHEFEGDAVLRFILDKLNLITDPWDYEGLEKLRN